MRLLRHMVFLHFSVVISTLSLSEVSVKLGAYITLILCFRCEHSFSCSQTLVCEQSSESC